MLQSGQKDHDLLAAHSGAGTAQLQPNSPFRGISGSEKVGRRMVDIHPLDQPAFPARPSSPWLVGPPGTPLSPCLSSFYLCLCCSALEASLQVRSLPVCQGLVQIPPSCPSFTDKPVYLREDSHTLLEPVGLERAHCIAIFKMCCQGTPPGKCFWVLVAGWTGLTHWSSDTFP